MTIAKSAAAERALTSIVPTKEERCRCRRCRQRALIQLETLIDGPRLMRRSSGNSNSSPVWRCVSDRTEGWIPLHNPNLLYKFMVPGATRVDNSLITRASFEDIQPSITGSDNRKPLANNIDSPYRWICKISVVYKSRRSGEISFGEGTGVMIGSRHVLTAGHLIFDKIRDKNTHEHIDTLECHAAVVIPGLNSKRSDHQMSMPFGWTWGTSFRTTLALRKFYCRYGHKLDNHDFAVIRLAEDFGARKFPALEISQFGYWGHPKLGSNTMINFKNASSIKGASVNFVGYPADRCLDQPVGRAISRAEYNACMPSDLGSVPFASFAKIVDPGSDALPFELMKLEHDLAPGMSGGPIWIRWGKFRNLLGIGVQFHKTEGNQAVRLTKHVINEILEWIK